MLFTAISTRQRLTITATRRCPMFNHTTLDGCYRVKFVYAFCGGAINNAVRRSKSRKHLLFLLFLLIIARLRDIIALRRVDQSGFFGRLRHCLLFRLKGLQFTVKGVIGNSNAREILSVRLLCGSRMP